MVYAIIDMGSNSVRLCAYKAENGRVTRLFNEKEMAGLAGYVENNALSQKGMLRAVDALDSFAHILRGLDIHNVRVFATASLRNVANTDEALAFIKERTGFDIHVITGEEEGALDFLGATKLLGLTDGLLVDIGGGSTELVAYADQHIVKSVSIPIGSLNLYTRNVSDILPTKEERKNIKATVKSLLDGVHMPSDEYPIIAGVGGTIRGARRIYNDLHAADDVSSGMDAAALRTMSKALYDGGRDARSTLLRLVPERIHTQLPGLIVLNTIIKRFHTDSVIVSDYGVREGYLFKYVLNEFTVQRP